MMRAIRGWALCGLVAVVLFAAGLAPARAADEMIPVARPTDLALPAAQVPAGFVLQPTRAQALTDAVLQPVIGANMLTIFHHNGWITGYHGWLDAASAQGAPFATYDLYGFATVNGARSARLAYQNLILGAQAQGIGSDALPKSAAIWTDTGTFGPANQPYAVAEIVFRVANVIGDVTGFYAGSGSSAGNAALQQATAVTVACVNWLSTRLPSSHHTGFLFLPLALLPRAFRRASGR